jgi:hypothetical protein
MSPTGEEGLSQDVVRFVQRHISSASQLDVLLLLRGAPERSWSAHAVAGEVYSDVGAIAQLLDNLAGQGFLETTTDGYRYKPRTAALRAGVETLADAYSRRRHRVVRAIYEVPDRATSFSEAFRLRKRDE